MKVCFVTHAPNLSGASRSLLDLLAALRKSEVESIVLLPKHGPIEKELKALGAAYRILPYVGAANSNSPWKTAVKRPVNRVSPLWIARFLKNERVDLVHNNSFLSGVGMEAARRAGIPYVCHLRELVQEDHQLEFLNEKKQNELLKRADCCIAISDFVRQKYSRLAPMQRFVTIFDGMNTLNYLDDGHMIFSQKTIQILLVGRIAPMKGHLDALQAVNALHERGVDNLLLKLVGVDFSASGRAGDYLAEIQDYISSHQLSQVELIPFANDSAELRRLRAQCDVNLVCSRAEAMGRVTIESQLAGCLTIGANAGATPELIQDGATGLLYEVGNPEDLADKIMYAVNHVEEMRNIARAGRQYAMETYDCNKYGEKIWNIYQDILLKHSDQIS